MKYFGYLLVPFFLSHIVLHAQGLEDFSETNQSEMIHTMVYFKVEHVEQWKETFQENLEKELKNDAKLLESGVLSNAPNYVYFRNSWSNLEDFQGFLDSKKTEKFLNKSGLNGKVRSIVFEPVEKSKMKGNKAMTLMYYKVQDFEEWRKTVESVKELRRMGGELSYEYGTLHDQPGTVYMLNEWASMKDFEKYMARPEFNQMMQAAGVIPPPTILMLERLSQK